MKRSSAMGSQLQLYNKGRLCSPSEDVTINKKKNYEVTEILGQGMKTQSTGSYNFLQHIFTLQAELMLLRGRGWDS